MIKQEINVFKDLELLKKKILEVRKDFYRLASLDYKPSPPIDLNEELLDCLLKFLSEQNIDDNKVQQLYFGYDFENNHKYIKDFSNLFISTLDSTFIRVFKVTYENVFVLITNFLFAKKELEDIFNINK